MVRYLRGLREIVDLYDLYLIDLWGVTHNGQALFPGVREALDFLKTQNKKIIFFSNAPRRRHVAQHRLAELGIEPPQYTDVYTSGEQAYRFLCKEVEASRVKRIFHIGTSKDSSLFSEIDVEVVKSPEGTDIIMCSDTEHWEQKVTDFDAVFEQLVSQKVPMICANSDRHVMYQGHLVLCAGALAERYASMGGFVHFFGKPHLTMYTPIFQTYQDIPKARMLAIGDSLYTDIQGAHHAGLETLFICGGIHMGDLHLQWGESPTPDAAVTVFQKYSFHPSYLLPTLCL